MLLQIDPKVNNYECDVCRLKAYDFILMKSNHNSQNNCGLWLLGGKPNQMNAQILASLPALVELPAILVWLRGNN